MKRTQHSAQFKAMAMQKLISSHAALPDFVQGELRGFAVCGDFSQKSRKGVLATLGPPLAWCRAL